MTLAFSANLGFLWSDRPLVRRIQAAAAAGFKAIELHWPYETPAAEVRRACEDNDIVLLGINTPVGNPEAGDFGLGAQPGREAEFRETFARAVDYARQAGATAIHVMAGVVPPEHRDAAAGVFIANLVQSAEAAPDLTLLLEAINPRDKPGYFYSTVDAVAATMDAVGAPNLKMMFDVYHVGVGEGDVLTRLSRHMPRIGHVQIAAVPSRAEPDEGEIAYPAIFATLQRLGYEGWIGCEYKPRADTDTGLSWVRVLGVSL